jgi:hypothetical protein
MGKKVLIISTSPRKGSNSDTLAEEFARGAQEAGHEVEKVGPLGTSLPRNDTQISVGPGDVILYQGNQITIYYETNSWNFTRLAVIEGATKNALLLMDFGQNDFILKSEAIAGKQLLTVSDFIALVVKLRGGAGILKETD